MATLDKIVLYLAARPLVLRALLALLALLLVLLLAFSVWLKMLLIERDLYQIKAERAGTYLAMQNQAIDSWKKKAEIQGERVLAAEKRAEQIRKESEKKSAVISSARVPADCLGALQWGAAETLRILEGRR